MDPIVAARQGNLQFFEEQAGDLVNIAGTRRDEDGRSLLHLTAASGCLPLVKLIAQHSSSVNTHDEEGWTPLHSAVSCGHTEVVDFLLQLGAEVNAKNSGGQTALHYAVSTQEPLLSCNLMPFTSRG
ncbi:ankyrin repeat-containing domain protein [Dunaliella salina]|uniref:Ankyrin repeat-containing domain protein n=1 Tax=Dunaliella salina TaxID=3046 RepID=A0ABQ7GP22_DUNSA|nr:ankyrin repeat-containing domain protein [Dunaliella salina]|eukprot:KAF5836354.1 ankyrin repeat-containing domain protein [Dunaliella salina]